MQFDSNTPRSERSIGQKDGPIFTVQVPQPYVAGAHTLTEGEASALNQIIAENLSNNLRAKLIAGQTDADGNVTGPHTAESAQALVDQYLASYEMGVRRTGTGEPRVTDPVEREARKMARTAANTWVKSQGLKTSQVGTEGMAKIVEQIFTKNRDKLMADAKKVVAAASKGADGLDLGIELPA